MTNFILQLVELALALAQSQLKGGDLEAALAQILQRGVAVYEDQTGKPVDPKRIGIIQPL